MTLQEFEVNYYVATGIGYITLSFIQEGIPETYDEKIEYFIKMVGYIQLLKNHSSENVIKKYGRFDINGNASELTQTLLEIIFGTTDLGEEIDNDESTEDITKISTYDSLDDITEKNSNDFYLVKTGIEHIYNGYTYSSDAFQLSDKKYFILNTDEEYTYTGQLPNSLKIHDIHISEEITDYENLIVVYQANTNSYFEYIYNEDTQEFVKTDTSYNDGDNTVDIGVDYILDDDKEYLITDDGRKILVY